MPVEWTDKTISGAQARVARLEEALSNAKAEVLALQAAELSIDKAPPQTHIETPATFRFMDLPKELRQLVYEWCLPPRKICLKPFVEKVDHIEDDMRFDIEAHIPWDIPRRRTSLPAPMMPLVRRKAHPLFTVSKRVGYEALKILRNTSRFYTLYGAHHVLPLSHIGPEEQKAKEAEEVDEADNANKDDDVDEAGVADNAEDADTHSPPLKDRFRHMSIAFDCRVSGVADDWILFETIHGRDCLADREPNLSTEEWREIIHEETVDSEIRSWEGMVQGVQDQDLHSLEVNVQNCCCFCGCTSLVERAIGLLCDWKGEGRIPDRTRFLGTRGDEERAVIREKALEGLGEHVEVSFAGNFDRVDYDGGMGLQLYDQLVEIRNPYGTPAERLEEYNQARDNLWWFHLLDVSD